MDISSLLTKEMAVAAGLVLLTILMLAGMAYFAVHAGGRNRDRETDAPPPAKKKGYDHCELNDIMGYDIIQIKTPSLAVFETPKEPREKSYSDSAGLGMTTREVSTTGAKPQELEDEPTPTKEEREKNRQQEKKNEEFNRRAEEEQMSKATDSVMDFFGNDVDWPETHEDNVRHSYFEEQLDNMTLEELGQNGDTGETDEESKTEYLAGKPADEQAYNENIENVNDIMESMYESVYGLQFNEEEQKAIAEIQKMDFSNKKDKSNTE